MFVQTEVTPNPNSLKFLPGKKVSNNGPYEITKKDGIQNDLVRNILSVNGVEGIFLGEDFISVNKADTIKWDDIKHIVISLINDFYADGKEFVIDENAKELKIDFDEVYSRTNTSYKPFPSGNSDYKSASSVERIEAFIALGRKDPVQYEDETGPVDYEVAKASVEKVLADYSA